MLKQKKAELNVSVVRQARNVAVKAIIPLATADAVTVIPMHNNVFRESGEKLRFLFLMYKTKLRKYCKKYMKVSWFG